VTVTPYDLRMLERDVRRRFWIEAGAAVLGFVLAVLTLAWPEWIEEIFGVEPDGGNGMAEWGIVLAFFTISVGLSVTARREWRRAAA
jgi:hypothetical protein